jgi:hypothetical protein
MENLHSDVIAWAEARKIIPRAQPYSQLMKGISEFGELVAAEVSIDEAMIVDGIGDTIVTLVIYTNLRGIVFSVLSDIAERESSMKGTPIADILQCAIVFGKLCDAEIKGQHADIEAGVVAVLTALYSYAKKLSLDPMICLSIAYDEIKDRKGTLMDNGTFVKETV